MNSDWNIFVAFVFVASCLLGNSGQSALARQRQGVKLEGIPETQKRAIPFYEVAPRAITIEDIVATKDVLNVQLSPDGESILFVVKEAVLDKNENKLTLFMISASGGAPIKVSDEKGISQIKWSPDGRFITYVSAKGGSPQVWRMRPDGSAPEEVTHHATGVGLYEMSPDGRKTVFLASEAVPQAEKEQAETEGVVFDYDLGVFGMLNKRWIRKPQQLWLFEVTTSKESTLYELTSQETSVFGLSWSPDSQKLAVVTTGVAYDTNIRLISVDHGEISSLMTGGANLDITWSPDSGRIAFVCDLGARDNVRGRARRLMTLDILDGKLQDIVQHSTLRTIKNRGWSVDGKSIYLEAEEPLRGERRLYRVPSGGGDAFEVTHDRSHLSQCSLNTNRSRAACILQDPTVPPEIAIINLNEGLPHTLTLLHPEYREIRLSEVSRLNLTNKFGNPFNAFLIKPLKYVAGRRYPLVVILYSFNGEFFKDVFGNYPIQAFAANEFAVLCINLPRLPYHGGDFKEGTMSEMYNPLACIEKGAETVIEMGIADAKKMGIMGWSYGSFITDFTITHSDLFAAASSGDGGLYGGSTYWIVDTLTQNFYDAVVGGPPFGEKYKNWQQVSPSLNARRLRIPLLMEYTDTNISSVDFYTAIKKQGGQVELVIYPNAPHVFNQGKPKQSVRSMQRNLDWFNFWLRDIKRPDPKASAQFTRWGAMKQTLSGSNTITGTLPTSAR
jgi:dipeptidyl aminopeptidase/acylaminoacyl peptidase